MKLVEVKNWKVVHFENRTILRTDRNLYPESLWKKLLSVIEVEPMDSPGHYRAI